MKSLFNLASPTVICAAFSAGFFSTSFFLRSSKKIEGSKGPILSQDQNNLSSASIFSALKGHYCYGGACVPRKIVEQNRSTGVASINHFSGRD